MSEDFDRATGEVFEPSRILTSPSPGRQHLMPISALPGSPETAQIWSAIIKAQETVKTPRRTKTANIQGREGRQGFSYKYAPIEEITKVLKPALIPNGLWFQQGLVYRGQQPFVRTMPYHTSGEWTASDYPVFGAQDSRSFAAAVSMAQRRGLMLAFGITPEDDNEEALEDASAEIKEPRTRPRARRPIPNEAKARHAGAFSSGHDPDMTRAYPSGASAEPADEEVVADGWAVAGKGVGALTAFCELLSARQKRAVGRNLYNEWLARAQAADERKAEHAE